jgi:hypothetical protein
MNIFTAESCWVLHCFEDDIGAFAFGTEVMCKQCLQFERNTNRWSWSVICRKASVAFFGAERIYISTWQGSWCYSYCNCHFRNNNKTRAERTSGFQVNFISRSIWSGIRWERRRAMCHCFDEIMWCKTSEQHSVEHSWTTKCRTRYALRCLEFLENTALTCRRKQQTM